MKYGPFGVSTTAARMRKLGLLWRSVRTGPDLGDVGAADVNGRDLQSADVELDRPASFAGAPDGCWNWPIQRWMLASTLPPPPAK